LKCYIFNLDNDQINYPYAFVITAFLRKKTSIQQTFYKSQE
jgi:hypothetical protein